MKDLTRDGKNLGAVRSHYPASALVVDKPNGRGSPYRDVGAIGYDLLRREGALNFNYKILGKFSRFHGNPPIWGDRHWHDFGVELEFKATQKPGDMYGADMIELQQILQAFIGVIPEVVNDLPGCESGTTESMCAYFSGVRAWMTDPAVVLTKVSVSECAERTTTLILEQ